MSNLRSAIDALYIANAGDPAKLERLDAMLDHALEFLLFETEEYLEPEAIPLAREAGAAYRRGGKRALRVVLRAQCRRIEPRARTPRAAAPRRRDSRRTSSSSRTSGTDPGDPDPGDPAPKRRLCSECGDDISDRRAHASTCGTSRCRMRRKRREDRERAAWRALADPDRPDHLRRPQLASPLDGIDPEVLAAWLEDTVGRGMHGRRAVAA